MRKKYCRIKVSVLIFVFTTVSAIAQNSIPDTTVIALVNSEPVSYREFMQQANRERSQVIRYFRITYGRKYTSDFWTQISEGKSPADILKKRSMDTLVKIKVQQILAKKWGIMSDISYNGFLIKLETENKIRLEAKNRNQVIYGPVQYTEDVYYSYLFTNMVNQLKAQLERDFFDISEKKLKEIYETDKYHEYPNGFYTKILLVEMKMASNLTVGVKDSVRNSVRISLNELRTCILTNDNCLGPATGKFKDNNSVSLVTKEIIFNDSVYAPEEENTLLTEVKEQAKTIKQGDCCQVMEVPGILYFFQILEKKSLGYRSFENCRNTIRAIYTDQLYSEYINALLLKTELVLNHKNYDLITF